MTTRTWTVRSSEDVGRAIAEIRRTRDLTQQDLAADAGMRRDWLAKLESGRSNRVLEQLLRLLRRLGAQVTISYDDEPQQRPSG